MRNDLGKALAIIVSVCIRRSDMDDMQVGIWMERMRGVLLEYPAVAFEALNDWPKTEGGKWWPTENEMRALCETLDFRRRESEANLRFGQRMALPSSRKPLSPLKTETALRFAAKVRIADPRTADLYLDHDAMYGEDGSIAVSPIGVVKLQPFAALATGMGLKIRERTFAERAE